MINQKLSMENRHLVEDIYLQFIDTLNLILLPKMANGIQYFNIIKLNLDELEGDCHTFLFSENINILIENKLIDKSCSIKIERIRSEILRIDAKLWNPNDFIENIAWINIRKEIVDLFKSELLY